MILIDADDLGMLLNADTFTRVRSKNLPMVDYAAMGQIFIPRVYFRQFLEQHFGPEDAGTIMDGYGNKPNISFFTAKNIISEAQYGGKFLD